MTIQFDFSAEHFNTQYAPLGFLLSQYQENKVLEPLNGVNASIKTVKYTPSDKLQQIFVSILGGCETLVEVNSKLKGDVPLERAGGWASFADHSTLSLALDDLSLKNIEELGNATRKIWQEYSGTTHHDWRGFLWLDYDLSGLPCGKQAEGSKKGYFSQKKRNRQAIGSCKCS